METFRNLLRLLLLLFIVITVHCVKPTGGSLSNSGSEAVQKQAAIEYKSAEKLFQQGQLAQAMALFQKITKEYYNTTSADNALLRTAQIYKREKNLVSTENSLKKLIKLYPDSDVKSQALRELVAITILQAKYEETLTYLTDMDLRKFSAKEQASLSSAANLCIQKVNRKDLELLWLINKTDVNPAQELKDEIKMKISSTSDEDVLEKIIERKKTDFPAIEAATRRYMIASEQRKGSESRKWATYIVEYFPTSDIAKSLRTEISEPGAGGGTYKIGVLLPLSGEQQSYGNQVLQGIKTAVEVVKLSSPSQNIQLVVQDIGAEGAAKPAMQKLLTEHQIIAAIGPLNSKDTESVAEMAQSNQLPLIAMSPGETVTSFGNTIFRNSVTKNEQAIAIAKLLVDTLGIKRAAILYPNNSYGKEFMELFWNEFVKKGGDIRGAEEYDRSTSDFETPIKKLVGLWKKDVRRNEICSKMKADLWVEAKKNGEPLPNCSPIEELPPIVDFEAIFIPDSFDKARQILPTLLYYDVKGVQVIGTNLWNTDELLAGSIGGEIEGSMFLDGFYKSSMAPETTTFMQKYYELNNAEPGILEAQGYDSAMLVLQAIINKTPSSSEGLLKALYKLDDFKGVTGISGFTNQREAVRNMRTLVVDQNKITELK